EARDTKGQTARTPEFVVRIAADPNAADRQLEAFDRAQDPFITRLAQLIAEQKKVQGGLEKTTREYAALTEKVRARQEASAETEKVDPKTGKPQPPAPVKLSPEEAKRLAELQKELAKLAGDEERNATTARQMNEELKRSVEQAGKLEMLPQDVTQQM